MTRWFRYYDSALDDPKVQKLEPRLFKAWVNLLCVASRNDGVIPPADAAFALRLNEREMAKVFDALSAAGLIDEEGGLRPHNWNGRQYKSDGSTERVKRFRERHGNGKSNTTSNGHETLHGTGPDTDSESERKKEAKPEPLAAATPPEISAKDRLWRDGPVAIGALAQQPPAKFRSVIGSWLKDNPPERVLAAIAKAQAEKAVDPVPFIAACLGKRKGPADGIIPLDF